MFKESLQYDILPNLSYLCKWHHCENTILTSKDYRVPLWHSNLSGHSFNVVHRKWDTFQHFLQTVPHDVDVLYSDKLELDVGVVVFILVAFPGSTVGHGVELQQLAKQNSDRLYSGPKHFMAIPKNIQDRMQKYNVLHHWNTVLSYIVSDTRAELVFCNRNLLTWGTFSEPGRITLQTNPLEMSVTVP